MRATSAALVMVKLTWLVVPRSSWTRVIDVAFVKIQERCGSSLCGSGAGSAGAARAGSSFFFFQLGGRRASGVKPSKIARQFALGIEDEAEFGERHEGGVDTFPHIHRNSTVHGP